MTNNAEDWKDKLLTFKHPRRGRHHMNTLWIVTDAEACEVSFERCAMSRESFTNKADCPGVTLNIEMCEGPRESDFGTCAMRFKPRIEE